MYLVSRLEKKSQFCIKVTGAALVFLGITLHVIGNGLIKKVFNSQQTDISERTLKASRNNEITIYSVDSSTSSLLNS